MCTSVGVCLCRTIRIHVTSTNRKVKFPHSLTLTTEPVVNWELRGLTAGFKPCICPLLASDGGGAVYCTSEPAAYLEHGAITVRSLKLCSRDERSKEAR